MNINNNLTIDTLATLTDNIWNCNIYSIGVPTCFNCARSLKDNSRYFCSNLYNTLSINYPYVLILSWPKFFSPWNHHSLASPSKCKIAIFKASSSTIGFSWKYTSKIFTQVLAELWDEPSKVGSGTLPMAQFFCLCFGVDTYCPPSFLVCFPWWSIAQMLYLSYTLHPI